MRLYTGAYISASATDPTNVPTTTLRPGLVMGIVTATGQWTNYSATATDGSNVAMGILPIGLRMSDVLTQTTVAKFYAMMVSGGVKAANLLGLDLMARAQLSQRFVFDDNFIGNNRFDWQAFVSKTANYQILASDNFTLFDNTGAVGEVDFTLPAIANGYQFGFSTIADQTLKVISTEGTNIVAFNNASATSVAFSTGGSKIGGGFVIYSNPGATKWIVQNASAGANTITVA